MDKYEKAAIFSSACDLEGWLEFTTDQQHKQIIEKVVWRLKKLVEDYDKKKKKGQS